MICGEGKGRKEREGKGREWKGRGEREGNGRERKGKDTPLATSSTKTYPPSLGLII